MRLFCDQAGGIAATGPTAVGGRASSLARDGGRRGMALILVLTSIAVLTAVAVDFAYNTQVDTHLAANARDELRAYYLAESATNLSRLILSFQHQIDQQADGILQQVQGMIPGVPSLGSIRLWEALPVESGSLTAFVQATEGEPAKDAPLAPLDPAPGEAVPASNLASFGTFSGSFIASIEDEEAKINLNRLNNPGTRGGIAGSQLLSFINDPRWNFLFDQDTSHGERLTREDIVIRLHDWIDTDEVETTLNLTSALEFFTPGFGDEEAPYTRYRKDYAPKNALFDSLEEVYQVAGITDRFMAAFGDRFTVYPDINAALNINTDDPYMKLQNIRAVAANPEDPALNNPLVIEKIMEQLSLMRALGPMTGITVEQFVAAVEAGGIAVNPDIKNNTKNNDVVDDQSHTFKIKAVGQVGRVTKTLVTVLRYDEGLGTLLYYRED